EYAGQTLADEGADARREADEIALPASRLGHRLAISQSPKNKMETFTLAGVTMPARNSLKFRSSRVSQQMKGDLIALAGHPALNSAAGGHKFPWNTEEYRQLSIEFFAHLDHVAPRGFLL
ncbi:hypothetical protein V8E36_003657, partial [Tilletia maclaganii]